MLKKKLIDNDLENFHKYINNISNLKFTKEIEYNNKINFLDLTLNREQHEITFGIDRKPSSTRHHCTQKLTSFIKY